MFPISKRLSRWAHYTRKVHETQLQRPTKKCSLFVKHKHYTLASCCLYSMVLWFTFKMSASSGGCRKDVLQTTQCCMGSVSRYTWKESIQHIDMYRSCKYRCTDISEKKYRYDILQYYLYLVYIKIGTIYPYKQPKYYNISSQGASNLNITYYTILMTWTR